MLNLESVSFSYGARAAVQNINLSLAKGRHLAVIGESGSGKSTLLKLIYGIHDLESGSIAYKDKPILGPKFNLIAGDDKFKYLAQDFGLMPYISAAENVGKFLSNRNPDLKKSRISELLELVEMQEFANVKAQYLSGGQQQRIALAKTIALEPELILLDEPFSQIDAFRASGLKRKLFNYFRKNQISCITATHDGQDVLSFADEVLVMKDGRAINHDSPKKIYENPTSHYVASLFGEVNCIPQKFLNPAADGDLLVYPQQLKISGAGIRAKVKQSYFRGNHYLIEAEYEAGMLYFESRVPILEGEGVFLSV